MQYSSFSIEYFLDYHLGLTTLYFQADYLQPKLLGVIGFFDLQLLNNNIPLEDKKLVNQYTSFYVA